MYLEHKRMALCRLPTREQVNRKERAVNKLTGSATRRPAAEARNTSVVWGSLWSWTTGRAPAIIDVNQKTLLPSTIAADGDRTPTSSIFATIYHTCSLTYSRLFQCSIRSLFFVDIVASRASM